MKKDKEIELDIDDDDDLLKDLDLDMDNPFKPNTKDDRNPITKIAKGAINSFNPKEHGLDFIGEVAKKALPKSYIDTYNLATSLKYSLSDITDEAEKIVTPAKKLLKTAIRKTFPINSKLIPTRISKSLKSFSTEPEEDSDSYNNDNNYTQYDPDQDKINTTLQTIFGANTLERKYDKQEDELNRKVDRKISEEQHEENKSLNQITADGISRLVGYQDTILDQYYRKSLELQHLQFFALRDLLEFTKNSKKEEFTFLQNIQKNTGLPNEVKVRSTETFWDLNKKNLIERGQERLHDKLRNLPTRLVQGVKSQINNFSSTVGNLGGGISTDDFSQLGFDPLEQAGEGFIGDEIRGSIGGRAGRYVKGLLPRDKVTNLDYFLRKLTREYPSKFNRYLHNANETPSLTSPGYIISQLLGDVSGIDEQVTHDLNKNATEAISWDLISRRTLIEIIPGFLSRSLEQLTNIHNVLSGNTNKDERLVFDTTQENFVPISSAENLVKKKLKLQINSKIKDNVQNIINHIDPDKDQLTNQERIELALVITKRASKGENFDPKDYIDNDDIPDSFRDKLSELISEKFNINDGSIATDTETRKQLNRLSYNFSNIQEGLGNFTGTISNLHDTGEKEYLRNLGVINKDTGTIDPEYRYKLLRELFTTNEDETVSDRSFLTDSDDRFSEEAEEEPITLSELLGIKELEKFYNKHKLKTATTEGTEDTISEGTEEEIPEINKSSFIKRVGKNFNKTKTVKQPITKAINSIKETKQYKNIADSDQVKVITNTVNDISDSIANSDSFKTIVTTLDDIKNSEQVKNVQNKVNDSSIVKAINTNLNIGLDNVEKIVTEDNLTAIKQAINDEKEKLIHSQVVKSIEEGINSSETIKSIKDYVDDKKEQVLANQTFNDINIIKNKLLETNEKESEDETSELGLPEEEVKPTIYSKVKRISNRLKQKGKDVLATTLNTPTAKSIEEGIIDLKTNFINKLPNKEEITQQAEQLNTNFTELNNTIKSYFQEDKPLNYDYSDKLDTLIKLNQEYAASSLALLQRIAVNTEVSTYNASDSIITEIEKLKASQYDLLTKKGFVGKSLDFVKKGFTGLTRVRTFFKPFRQGLQRRVLGLLGSVFPTVFRVGKKLLGGPKFLAEKALDFIIPNLQKIPARLGNVKKYLVNPLFGLAKQLIGFTTKKLFAVSKFFLRKGIEGLVNLPKNIYTGFKRLGRITKKITSPVRFGVKLLKAYVNPKIMDIYKLGNLETPILTARGMVDKVYFNAKSGKVINTINDITDTVIDSNGNVIITKEDLNFGIVDKNNKPVFLPKIRIKNVINKLNPVNIVTNTKDFLVNTFKQLTQSKIKDVYVKGEDTPRLYAEAMKQGLYFDAVSKKVIKNIKNIKGNVIDKDGNVILNEEDISQGLIDSKGDLIYTKVIKKTNNLKSKTKFFGLNLTSTGGLLATLTNNILNRENEQFTQTEEKETKVVELLEKIYNHIKSAFPTNEGEEIEANREHGYKSILRRKEAAKKTKEEAEKNKTKTKGEDVEPTDKKNLFEALADSVSGVASTIGTVATTLAGYFGIKNLGGFFSKIASIPSKLGSILSKGANLAIEAAPTISRYAGVAGRTALSAGRVAMAATPEVLAGASTLAAGAGSTITTGAIMAGTGLTAAGTFLLTNPIGWSILGTSALAYSGYKLYKYASKRTKLKPLEKLRYLQYGIPIANKHAVVTIRYLEDELKDDIEIAQNGLPKVKRSIEKIWSDFHQEFGSEETNQTDFKNFSIWFNERFLPVYIKHKINAIALENTELMDVDDKLTPDLKFRFLNEVQFTDKDKLAGFDPLAITNSPWHDIALEDNSQSISTLVEQIKNLLKRGIDVTLDNLKNIKKTKPILPAKTDKKDDNKLLDNEDLTNRKNNIANGGNKIEDSFIDDLIRNANNLLKNPKAQLTKAYDVGKNIIDKNVFEPITEAFKNVGNTFKTQAPILLNRLIKDFGLSDVQAAGIVGNLGHESAGLKAGIEEVGGGGLGWAQWTGSRRNQFEALANATGKSVKDPELNYLMLYNELTGPYKKVIDKLKTTNDVKNAVYTFERGFERSADVDRNGTIVKQGNYNSRYRYAQTALELIKGNTDNTMEPIKEIPPSNTSTTEASTSSIKSVVNIQPDTSFSLANTFNSIKEFGSDIVSNTKALITNPSEQISKAVTIGKELGGEAIESGKVLGSKAIDWGKEHIFEPIANSLSGIIQKAESGNKGYNAYNRGTSGNKILGPVVPRDLTKLSIAQILQDMGRPPNDPQRLFAVGKYQMIPSTLKDSINKLGLDTSTPFNPKTQEYLFSNYLLDKKRPTISAYIKGKNDNVISAAQAASYEWASIADPATGSSHYGNGNKASVSTDTIVNALKQSKKLYEQYKTSGLSDNEAFQKAVASDGSQLTEMPNKDDNQLATGLEKPTLDPNANAVSGGTPINTANTDTTNTSNNTTINTPTGETSADTTKTPSITAPEAAGETIASNSIVPTAFTENSSNSPILANKEPINNNSQLANINDKNTQTIAQAATPAVNVINQNNLDLNPINKTVTTVGEQANKQRDLHLAEQQKTNSLLEQLLGYNKITAEKPVSQTNNNIAVAKNDQPAVNNGKPIINLNRKLPA